MPTYSSDPEQLDMLHNATLQTNEPDTAATHEALGHEESDFDLFGTIFETETYLPDAVPPGGHIYGHPNMQHPDMNEFVFAEDMIMESNELITFAELEPIEIEPIEAIPEPGTEHMPGFAEVIFHGNGHTQGMPPESVIIQTPGSITAGLTYYHMSREGFEFNGWFHPETIQVIRPGQTGEIIGTGTVHLYAMWKPTYHHLLHRQSADFAAIEIQSLSLGELGISDHSHNGQRDVSTDQSIMWTSVPGATYRIAFRNLDTNNLYLHNESVGSRASHTIPQCYLILGHRYRVAVEIRLSATQYYWQETVFYAQEAPLLRLSPHLISWNVRSAAADSTPPHRVITNQPTWIAQSSDLSWLTLSQSGDDLTFHVSVNTSTSSRSGTVTVIAGNATSHTIEVIQPGATGQNPTPTPYPYPTPTPTSGPTPTPGPTPGPNPGLDVNVTSWNFPAEGGSSGQGIVVTVNPSTLNWHVSIAGSPSWLSYERSGDRLILNAQQNISLNQRDPVDVRIITAPATHIITVTQQAGTPVATMDYRILVNFEGNSAARITQANGIMDDVKVGFRNTFGVDLVRQYARGSTLLNQRAGCVFPYACNPRCGELVQIGPDIPIWEPLHLNGNDCREHHHRSGAHFLAEEQSSIYTFRFVGFELCHHGMRFIGSFRHFGVHGLASGVSTASNTFRDTIVSVARNWDHQIAAAHEISHLLGATDPTRENPCTPGQRCVMYGGLQREHYHWCDRCIAAIRSYIN